MFIFRTGGADSGVLASRHCWFIILTVNESLLEAGVKVKMEFKFSFFDEGAEQQQQQQEQGDKSHLVSQSLTGVHNSNSCRANATVAKASPLVAGQIVDVGEHTGQEEMDADAFKEPLQVWAIPGQVKLVLWQTRNVSLESLSNNGLDRVVAKTDVHEGFYEGGFKLWECSIDVVRFLHARLGQNSPGKRVLDLGCGHGVPGVFLLKQKLARSVMFQDLNREVLIRQTVHNVRANCAPNPTDALKCCSFVSGDWSEFKHLVDPRVSQFDLIITAETVYNVAHFETLHSIFETYLAEQGMVIIAAKRFYFGVGGGSHAFKEFVQERGLFQVEEEEEIVDGCSNVRDILVLKKLSR